ncbi:MAG: ubiquinone/menaquinone biosynthesis methyltransferase [Candidatus Acidiferrales bacterium]
MPPAPGTQPEGIRDERAAASYVREMFSRIAPRYDLLNHLLSLNLDRVWRRRTARRFAHILSRGDASVLDLCCGTGDLTLALADEAARVRERGKVKIKIIGGTQRAQRGTEFHRGATIWGSDFAHPMLVRAVGKAGKSASPDFSEICFVEADALALPWPEASFDLVTVAFGFRNLANYQAGLREIRRVLKPGGEVGILEFAAPRSRMIAALYRMYFTRILPRIGGAVSGSRNAYTYLPASVMKFPSPEELQSQMRAIGFTNPRTALWTFGVVALHTARKP